MVSIPGLPNIPRLLQRTTATAQNAAELVMHGGLDQVEIHAPYDVVATHDIYKLRRYFPDDLPADAPVMLLVHPLMITADVWDIAPSTSAVTSLHELGIDVWTVDFGRPEHEPGGLERTLTDHALAVSDAVDEVRAATGKDVTIGGQSQGGMFCYQAAAYRRGEGIASIVTFGSPVDTRAPLGVPMSPETAATIAGAYLNSGLARRISIPGWAMRGGTQMLTPISVAKGKIQYYKNLHDKERLLPRERLRMFLDGEGWTAYSGPAFAELLEQFMVHNRMLEGGFVFRDRLVSLADLEVPILTVVGTTDILATPPAVRGIRRAAPRADVYELSIPIGHFGIIGGNTARKHTWPAVGSWIHWRAGSGELLGSILPADQVPDGPTLEDSAIRKAIGWAADLGIGSIANAVSTVDGAVSGVQAIARAGLDQLPKLRELGNLDPGTRVSLGMLLDDAAEYDPNSVVYAFGDRVIRHGEFKYRVDSIVRGMLSVRMRPGERIGVLMASRPSALSAIAAISRLGGTAVLLRPGGDLEREARLGRISWLISDPENARETPLPDITWCVLGVSGDDRKLPEHVFDMETIDPARVKVPAWFTPNPREASDLAFVLFTGEGEHIRAVPITNRRWAVSARVAAAAAGLKNTDTVYSVTPMYHSSAVLHTMAAAIASGARLALASETDPDTFWTEVRRYGATHVSYTWASMLAITDGPIHPAERDNQIRVFMGSGMPAGLWRRVLDRFPRTRVVDVFASADGDGILGEDGSKVGSAGRPLPGTPDVKVVRYALKSRRIATDGNGFGQETAVDEIGLLVVRGSGSPRRDVPIRNLFEAGDSWVATGDLFRRDADGDLWFEGPVRSTVEVDGTIVVPAVIKRALDGIGSVALATAYDVPTPDGPCLVAAVAPIPGAEITASDIERALATVPETSRPEYVVARDIPFTAWWRPDIRALRAAGVPTPRAGVVVWRRSSDGHGYRPVES